MGFEPTELQQMLRDTLRSHLAKQNQTTAFQTGATTGLDGTSLWRGLAHEVGLLGLPFPSDYGGLGLGAEEVMVAMEELGRASANEPILECIIAVAAVLADAPPRFCEQLIPDIASGAAVAAFAHCEPNSLGDLRDVQLTAKLADGGRYVLAGQKSVVVGGGSARYLFVSARLGGGRYDAAGLALFVVSGDAVDIGRREYHLLDGRSACDLEFKDVVVDADMLMGTGDAASAMIERALDTTYAALCAEAVGIMGKLAADTLEYTRNRRQAGKALADHQVVQHRIVDMAVLVEQASALAQVAAMKLDGTKVERTLAVSAAASVIGPSVKSVAQSAIQLHGGMGMTDEIAIGALFRRATMIERQLRSPEYHISRWAELTLPLKTR